MGHSFGGGAVLEAVAALAKKPDAPRTPRVAAAVLLDPWLFGCSDAVYAPSTHAAVGVPTMCVNTQTLMFPSNAHMIGRALHAVGEAAAPRTVAWLEAAGTRHQEASDFAAIGYPLLRLMCMAGALRPRESLGRHTAATVGFLAHTGAQPLSGCPQQQRAKELVAALLGEGDGAGRPSSGSDRYEPVSFVRHGCNHGRQ